MTLSNFCHNSACGTSLESAGSRLKQHRPCCDASCIQEIARRECMTECAQVDLEKYVHSGDSHRNLKAESPCKRHYESAKARYGAKLEAIGCICKALLALGAQSCCTKPEVSSLKYTRSNASIRSLTDPTRRSRGVRPRDAQEAAQSCCKPETDEECKLHGKQSSCRSCPGSVVTENRRNKQDTIDDPQHCPHDNENIRHYDTETTTDKSIQVNCCTREASGSCSGKTVPVTGFKKIFKSLSRLEKTDSNCSMDDCFKKQPVEMLKTSCCVKKASSYCNPRTQACDTTCSPSNSGISRKSQDTTIDTIVTEPPSCSVDTCCQHFELPGAILPTGRSLLKSSDRDLEKGNLDFEHIVLHVKGMTCTGCEKKLLKSVRSLQLVQNVTTSLVMEQVQFDLDVSNSALPVDEVVSCIEKMTGFTCVRVIKSGQDLEVFVEGSVQDFVRQELPFGVTCAAAIGKHTARITYDPSVIGARDLLSKLSATLTSPESCSKVSKDTAHFRRMLLITILSVVLTIPVLVLAWAPLPEYPIVYGSISLALATVIQIAVAGPFYPNALKSLIYARMIEVDLLIVLSTSAAYVYSVIAFAYEVNHTPLATGEFFETSTLLVTLIMAGRTVSTYSRRKAMKTISIESLRASKALLFHPESNEIEEIDARLLQYGDRFKLLPDMKVVTDGIVETGETELDESMITGEPIPVSKFKGSTVIAGSVNSFGTIVVKLTRLPGENFISDISNMLEKANFIKPKVQDVANRFASYFTPFILIITLLVFVIWIAIGKTIRHESTATAAISAMTYAISALIVSCPCAIGLAVPMVVVVAGGVAAKHGVIFKSASAIEIARKVTHVVFDKTGTLTQGKFSVVREVYTVEKGLLPDSMAMGLMSNSKHPVASAIAAHLKRKGNTAAKVEDTISLAGKGMEGTWNEHVVRAGNPQWLNLENLPVVQDLFSSGLTVLCLCLDNDPLAIFGLEDSLRPDATEVITRLQRRNISISLLSGDNHAAVHSLARRLNLPDSHVRAQCSPADKQHYVRALLDSPKHTVLFCGDGTNDAVALAQASIGLHMSEGTDVASNAADAVLLRPALSGILVLMDLSAAFHRRVCFNFFWAFVYNVFAILLAGGAFVDARIPPQYAGLGELVSVLPVVAIAMQLRWSKFE